ncbi:unnamed protein product [Parnassius mnemosyne]|uniref:TATA element modulatory factor 1 TATA binding domain-containing protein n=1 Tax=Parnassius mnemosyne TaxID=213953 RepID=A0AAV1KS26_9NEOP
MILILTLTKVDFDLAEAETCAAKAAERERLARDESDALRDRLALADALQSEVRSEHDALAAHCQRLTLQQQQLELELARKNEELEQLRSETETQISDLQQRLTEVEHQLETEKATLDTERKRNAILQEQLSSRGDISPPHSVASDTLSASLWAPEEGGRGTPPVMSGMGGAVSAPGVEEALAALTRRDGELRAAASSLAALRTERAALRSQLARLHEQLADQQSLQEQYDALLQMYGEKEEQLAELRLDLQDVTQLYKAQLDELVALKGQR